MEGFEQDKLVKMSPLKTYRDQILSLELDNGTYFVIPSTKTSGKTGDYFLSFYFQCQ